MRDQLVQHGAAPRRIRDDLGREALDGERVLSGRDVTGIGAGESEGFEVPHEVASTSARLGKAANPPKVREERRHRFRWRRVEVAWAPLEATAALAHSAASRNLAGISSSRGRARNSSRARSTAARNALAPRPGCWIRQRVIRDRILTQVSGTRSPATRLLS